MNPLTETNQNILEELTSLLTFRQLKLKAATLSFPSRKEDENDCTPDTTVILKPSHSRLDYLNFLSKINVDYDCGFGIQELYGTLWFDDGTWATRSEYDGSEHWNHHKMPSFEEEEQDHLNGEFC